MKYLFCRLIEKIGAAKTFAIPKNPKNSKQILGLAGYYRRFIDGFSKTTDASGFAVGGILSQGKVGKDKHITYTFRSLNYCERKYDTYEKEAFAVIYCVTYFRSYLYRRKFTSGTDNKPLVWFQHSKDPCSRITRWTLKLTEYDFDVAYKAGKTNVNADSPSRNPIHLEDIKNDDINNKNSIEIN